MGRDTLPLLLLFLLLAAAAAAASDADAIHDLAKSVQNLGWLGTDVCAFQGVTCERGGSGKVTELNLADRRLSGSLPPSLSTLTSLTALQLQGNHLTGDVPSLARMGSLTRLALDSNAFASLPPDFLQGLTSLQSLTMDDLGLLRPWSIPDAISTCSSLQTFSASNASIVGAFPAVLGSLESLRYLRLSYNNLTGELPPTLGQLSAMESLQLNNQQSEEKLSGRIDVVAAMKSLKLLWIQSNKFTGPIPDLSGLQQLESFNVRDNMLTGVVPASFTGLTSLKNVTLSNNNFQGPVPVFPSVQPDVSSGNGFCNKDKNPPGPCSPLTTTLLEVAGGFGYPYDLATKWTGNDPCGASWSGIICNSSDVSIINLSKRNFSGTISPAIANLTRLVKLDLSNNNLTGEIPDVLTILPYLTVLNVANNSLIGQVPKFKPSVNLLIDGNRFGESGDKQGGGGSDGGSSSSDSAGGGKSRSNTGMVIGIIVAAIILFACVGLLVRHLKKKNNMEKFRPVSTKTSPAESEMMKIQVVGTNGYSNGSSAVPTELYSHVSAATSANIGDLFESHGMQLSMEVLLKATNDFSEDCILGRGGFGVVFKGDLNGKLVAVKRCDSGTMGTKGQQEFLAEIDVLRKVRHRHLVALLGYCTHGNERLLVYEYMSGGTLREHLCDLQQSGYNPLTWTQRMIIALDVARGIEYLHGLAQETFIHRDLKPSNILLDQDLRAKVSDFGLVKLAKDTDKSLMTRVAGTFGYLAPEYATTGKVTTKVDVYAYGVILMEMIAGRKVLDDSLPDDETHLVTIFRRNMLDKEKFRKFVDPTLELSAESWKSLLEVADLARHCTAREPYQRPDMCHCVNRLSSLVDQWKPTNVDEDDDEGESSEMGLHQQLEKWRSDDFTISDSDTFSSLNMPRKYN